MVRVVLRNDSVRRVGHDYVVDGFVDYGVYRMPIEVEVWCLRELSISEVLEMAADLAREFEEFCSTRIPIDVVEYPFTYVEKSFPLVPGFEMRCGLEHSTTVSYGFCKIVPLADALKSVAERIAGEVNRVLNARARISWFDTLLIEWEWDRSKGVRTEIDYEYPPGSRQVGVAVIPKPELVAEVARMVAKRVSDAYREAVERARKELEELEKRFVESGELETEDIVLQSIEKRLSVLSRADELELE